MTVFSVLAHVDEEGQQARSRALTAARVRAQNAYGGYLGMAKDPENHEQRLSMLDEDLRLLSKAISAEYNFPGVEEIYDTTREFLAAEPQWEDNYQHERQDLPKSDGTGLGDTGAVPTDKASAGDVAGNSLEPIDVKSEKNKLDHQDAGDRAEYNDSDFDPKNGIRERIDPSKPLQPEYTTADNTDTWSSGEGNSAGQADPVTPMPSGSFLSKYRIISTD